MLRELFRLPYRQTEGLGRTLARLLQADIAIPDFTSLAKRAGKNRVMGTAGDEVASAARQGFGWRTGLCERDDL